MKFKLRRDLPGVKAGTVMVDDEYEWQRYNPEHSRGMKIYIPKSEKSTWLAEIKEAENHVCISTGGSFCGICYPATRANKLPSERIREIALLNGEPKNEWSLLLDHMRITAILQYLDEVSEDKKVKE